MRLQSARLFFAACFMVCALAACDSAEEKEARYIKRGNELFEEGAYEKARLEYKNALRLKPADPEIAYRLGLIDEAQGNFASAFGGFTRAEQQNDRYHPALLKLAEYYIAGGQYERAKERIGKVLADLPDDAGAHALNAAILLRHSDNEGAEKEARLSLSKDPANVTAFSVLAGVYNAQNDTAKALATVEEGIRHNPKNLALLLLKADTSERMGDFIELAKCYEAIFRIAPNDPRYRINLASVFLKAGRTDDAEAALRAGVENLPQSWDLKRRLVSFLADRRGLDAAETEIRSYMQAYPEKGELTEWLVNVYASHNAIERATAFLKDLAARDQLSPQGIAARASLARIYYIKGDRNKAQELADNVLATSPGNLDALLIRAHIQADKGFTQNAVTNLRTILRERPKAKEALQLLTEMLVVQGRIDLAIDTLNELVDADPLNFAARVRLAQLYHQNGDSKHAMGLLFSVTKTEPSYAVGWESTARIAIDVKDWSTAEAAVEKLEAIDGQQPTAAYLRGEILRKNGKTAESLIQLKRAIEFDPASPLAEHAIKALIEIYAGLGRTEEAARYIESLKTNDPEINTLLGETYLAAGKHQEAALVFDAAICNNSQRPEPY
ncbi:MAG: tetratricopeptide repeat protein, partial [Bdellovibrionales bacterium]